MTVGLSEAVANDILDALCKNAALSTLPAAAVHVQLHVDDPGADGTSNAATETDRVQATFGTVAADGAISNTAALSWTSVAGTEDYSHFSAWTAATDGTFLFSGTVTANAVTTGDTFTIPVGGLDVTLTVATDP